MRSRPGLFASIAFLLALPLAALCEMVLGTGGEAMIHAGLALGSALMSFAVFDFKTPRWATWMDSATTGVLAAVFFLQGLSELVHDEALTYLAYQVLGIAAMTTVVCARAYSLVLTYHGTSLDAEAPILKMLWLMPFVWILFEGMSVKNLQQRDPG